MAKFILHWTVDTTRAPEDPKERKQQLLAFMDTVQKQIAGGKVTDWGINVGEKTGYSIFEGTEVEVATYAEEWVPWATFSTRMVLSAEQSIEVIKAMSD